jgi:hypothetical protein
MRISLAKPPRQRRSKPLSIEAADGEGFCFRFRTPRSTSVSGWGCCVPRKSGSQRTHRWREMDSNYRSPVKDQLVETVLFDFPAEARKRTIGGRRSQPRDLGGDLRRDHNLRDDNDRLGWGRRQTQNGGSPDGGPMVRIMLPPAESPTRTSLAPEVIGPLPSDREAGRDDRRRDPRLFGARRHRARRLSRAAARR